MRTLQLFIQSVDPRPHKEKGWAINRVNNEGDSLGGFRLRIAAFDAGCANAAAEQEAPPTKDGGIDPKGW